jgi:chaperonin GroES
MAKIFPTSNHLVVEPIEEEVTSSGIIIPDTASKEKPQKGKVIAVGPGKLGENNERIPMEIKEGDVVLFKEWGGSKVKLDGKELMIFTDDEVLAILK